MTDIPTPARPVPVWHDTVAATHEAGHVAVALQYGIKVISVTIRNDGNDRRPAQLEVKGKPRSMRARSEWAVMLLAGREAERLYFAEPLPEGSDADDLEQVETVLTAGMPMYVEQSDGAFISARAQLPDRIAQLRKRARRLVNKATVRYNIDLIRNALLQCHTLTAGDIAMLRLVGFAPKARAKQ